MLRKTLDAQRYPYARIHVVRTTAGSPAANVTIGLHGVARSYEVPVRIDTVRGGISVGGKMSLKQTDFGIVPLSVLGGALQVQDELEVRFQIVAQDRGF